MHDESARKIMMVAKGLRRICKELGFGALASDMDTTSNQLAMGIKVEVEHKDLYAYIKTNGLPDEKTFYSMIAKAHIKEMPDYYTRLAAMEGNE
jgi:hypothetical protein